MRTLASRVAIVGSLLFLIVWIVSALVATAALAAGNFGLAATLARPAWTMDLPLIGFLGLMVLALAMHFMPLFAGRELRSPLAATIVIVLAMASIGVSLGSSRLLTWGRSLWRASASLFVGLILWSLTSSAVTTRPEGSREGLRIVDRRSAFITRASAVYLLSASAGFVLVSPGGRRRIPALGPYGNSVFHLFAVGFVGLSLIGLASHLLPRLLDAVPSARLVKTLTVLAITGPAGVALTIPYAGTDGPARFLFSGLP